MNKLNNYEKYNYYEYGIKTAEIIFEESKIKIKQKDMFSNEWDCFKELNNDTIDNFIMPLSKIIDVRNSIKSKDISNNQESIVLDNLASYRRINDCSTIQENAEIYITEDFKIPLDMLIYRGNLIGFIMTISSGTMYLIKDNYENVTPYKEWNMKELSDDRYKIHFLGNIMVEMSDGIKLSTGVWLPSGNFNKVKFPAILVRTPYGKRMRLYQYLHFVRRGYALIIQDIRGREDSEGNCELFINEIDDGNETLTWISNQLWSDGNIGTIGASYDGYTQWSAAAKGNVNLKAVISQVTAGTPFVDSIRKGGCFESGILGLVFMLSSKKFDASLVNRNDWEEILKIKPIKDIPKKVLNREIDFWNDWMNHENYDEYWESANYVEKTRNIDFAALLISGWFDDDAKGTTQAWEMIKEKGIKNKKLILGPWKHKFNSSRMINEFNYGSRAIIYNIEILYLMWFDKYLKYFDNKIEKSCNVEYFLLGENKWKSSNEWPPTNVEHKKLYFESSGNAAFSKKDGKISESLMYSYDCDEFTYDPDNPAPYLINISDNELNLPADYSLVENRNDVIVYTSKPLEKSIKVVGYVEVEFFASCSAKDTDWIVRLTEVDEECRSIKLADGILRAKYRESFHKPELLEKNKIEKYNIKMDKLANTFKKGNRIRISITSGAKNFVFPNTNTGNNQFFDTKKVTARQKIYHSSEFPSFLKLPILNE